MWTGRYSVFEKVLAALVGLMFVTMVGAALLTLPNLPELLTGLAPRIPDGGLVNTLALAGGVGGTITLAAYGYWLREKGWSTPAYMRVMRIDNSVAYVVTGIFVLATLIVGAELLYSTSVAIEEGDAGLARPLGGAPGPLRPVGRQAVPRSASGRPRCRRSSACGTASA